MRRQGAQIDFESLAAKYKPQQPYYEKMVYKAFDFIKGMPAVLFSKMILQLLKKELPLLSNYLYVY